MNVTIHHNEQDHRYEIFVDGDLAGIAVYHRDADAMSLVHTETLDGFTRQGRASQLIAHVLDEARDQGLDVLPRCSFVVSFISQHADDYLNLVPENRRGEFGL